MFLYDFTIVDAPVEFVADRLRDGAREILREAAARAGGAEPAPPATGALRPRGEGWALSVQWERSGWPGPFARLGGELEVAPVHGGRTHLSVSASWDGTGTRTSTRSESLRARHETETVVREFLLAAAGLLTFVPLVD
ncbi:MAG: hypothetical protein RL531_1745 [Actinomycetota bacterium]|jgi:hypothetical protein